MTDEEIMNYLIKESDEELNRAIKELSKRD